MILIFSIGRLGAVLKTELRLRFGVQRYPGSWSNWLVMATGLGWASSSTNSSLERYIIHKVMSWLRATTSLKRWSICFGYS
ncbi:uncharacterized protein VTP21DRAFT_11267 [Calcarisporiella thermophila]|uniref:uncharacterized protein n=1 Tax=Calcarisporiella thermophila TaxID=911321 RepID=UPI003743F614